MNSMKTCLLLLTGLLFEAPLPSAFPSEGNFDILMAATPTVVQHVGRPVLLRCELPNRGKHSTSWSKLISDNGEGYLSISNGTEIQDDRYALVEDSDGRSTSMLKIKNLQPTDAGFYQCSVPNPNSGNLFFYKVELGVIQ